MARAHTCFALAGLAALAAGCAASGPGAVSTGFSSGAGRPDAPAAARAEAPGYQINGDVFSGDMIFEARGDRLVVVYRHAVDGAPLVVAELDLARDWLADGVQRFVGRSERGLQMEVALSSGPCRQGGRLHARFAEVRAGAASYEGCARETGPVISWSERLPRFLNAVEACETDAATGSMAFVRRGGGHVIHARTAQGDPVLRYRFGQGGRWDCTVRETGVDWRVVPAAAPAEPGEGDPIFAPGRMPEAGEGCYLYERVHTADGRLLGALGQDVCSGDVAGAPDNTPFG